MRTDNCDHVTGLVHVRPHVLTYGMLVDMIPGKI